MEKANHKLPEEVAKKYQVLKGRPFLFVHRKLGVIDLNTASMEQVDRLVKAGVQHIVPRTSEKKG